MNKNINVLIVEDEPLIIDSLTKVLEHISKTEDDLDFEIKSTINCDTANKAIENAILTKPLDLVLMDISIPASKDGSLLSGEDLGLKIRDYFPLAKIIVFTSHKSNYRLNNILITINPEAFLIKSEMCFSDLTEAIKIVLEGNIYYSNTILCLVRLHISTDFTLDKTNRQILHLLSKSILTKDLPNFINLSKGGVERRKRVLKEIFNVEHKNDGALLMEASKKGFI